MLCSCSLNIVFWHYSGLILTSLWNQKLPQKYCSATSMKYFIFLHHLVYYYIYRILLTCCIISIKIFFSLWNFICLHTLSINLISCTLGPFGQYFMNLIANIYNYYTILILYLMMIFTDEHSNKNLDNLFHNKDLHVLQYTSSAVEHLSI